MNDNNNQNKTILELLDYDLSLFGAFKPIQERME